MAEENFVDKYLLPKAKAFAMACSLDSGKKTGFSKFSPLNADVGKVVRCKDCKHWDCYGGEDAHKGDCTELVGLDSCMDEDDFCSYGELKELG